MARMLNEKDIGSSKLYDSNGAPITVSNRLPVSLAELANPLPVALANNPLTTDLKLRVSNTPFGYDLSSGNLPGTDVSIMGSNQDVDNTEEDLWIVGGSYVYPAAAQRMEVISSSALDAPGQTGALTVKIWYLTSAFVEKTETITLNGTNAVPTVAADIYRVNFSG